jgi:hypothetical protein
LERRDDASERTSKEKGMMRRFGSLVVALAVLVSGGVALAQKKDTAKPAAAPAGAAAPGVKRKEYSFDADQIEGELVRPTGEFSSARNFAEHGSLIRIRTDFVPEIVKSAEDL